MQYGKLRGIDKPVSRFIVGTMDFRDPAKFNDYFAKLDKAFEYGINTIDTAEGYGMGRSEMAIGQWMKDRGNREQIIITTKCCHPMPWRKRVTWFDMAAGITGEELNHEEVQKAADSVSKRFEELVRASIAAF